MAPPPVTEVGYVSAASAFAAGRAGFASWGIGAWDDSEQSPAWQWPTSIATADRMSRHPQIAAVWWALTRPLRRDIWALDPQDADPERVALLAEDMDLPIITDDGRRQRRPVARRRGRFSYADYNRLRLLHLRWGAMAFAQVYDADALRQTGMARLRKLSPRFPRTWSHIETAADGGLVAIHQYALSGGTPVTIPVADLVVHVNEREGANWQGQSILRNAWRAYDVVDRLERVEAMTGERNGMGIPQVVTAAGVTLTPAQVEAANEIASAWRAGEFSSAAMPAGSRIELTGVSGTLPDLNEPINRWYALMAKSVQAQFMELGTGSNTGNRALGESFIDLFALTLDAISNTMADVDTQHVVEDWWDFNYGTDDPAPAVVAQPVDAERDISPEALKVLIDSGAVDPDDDLEYFLRRKYRLPAKSATAPTLLPEPPVPPFLASRDRRSGATVTELGPRSAGAVRVAAASADRPYAERITDALAAIYDPDAIAAAIEGGTNPAEAVDAAVVGDTVALEAVLSEVWETSWAEGVRQAQERLPSAAAPVRAASLAETIRNLAASVASSLRDRLVARSSALVAEGNASRSILAEAMTEIMGDSERGRLIADTESHRLIVAATLDTWRGAGIEEFRWVRNSGSQVSDVCGERDGTTGSWSESEVPAHVNCKCSLEPA